ncbi:hypothetical protein P167DRAFT_571642 [Morchella conica CCBAS932]|uniref:Uncharacterized protein n=1 Tax=Morchella conica CCBAS932 TaxID=1392247 RepID=A0A3N4L0B6_9PEZI|nr:hypothetical protein P167DRAFT_571642 [Morchella conica CCBAS932]
MNPTFSKTPISTIFIFALTTTSGAPDPQYQERIRSNSVEMITIVTSIASVLVAILTLAFMGYKHWKKSKQDLLSLPTTATSHAPLTPTKDDNDIFCIYFILMYIASTQSCNSRPTTSYAPRPALEIERRSGDLECNLK